MEAGQQEGWGRFAGSWCALISQKVRNAVFALGLVLLVGCVPKTAVVHDGLEGVVVDADTRQPLTGAFVYDGIEEGRPRILAMTDSDGRLQLDLKTKWTLAFPTGEAMVWQSLWVCKDGYTPVVVGRRSGWNADYSPGKYLKPGTIELRRSASTETERCLKIEW